jgi:hypothetical protein
MSARHSERTRSHGETASRTAPSSIGSWVLAADRHAAKGMPWREGASRSRSKTPDRGEALLLRGLGWWWVDGAPQDCPGTTDESRHDPLPSTCQHRGRQRSLMSSCAWNAGGGHD